MKTLAKTIANAGQISDAKTEFKMYQKSPPQMNRQPILNNGAILAGARACESVPRRNSEEVWSGCSGPMIKELRTTHDYGEGLRSRKSNVHAIF